MRPRTRNLLAVGVMWAGLTTVAAAEPVIADSGPRSAAVDDGAVSGKAAKKVALVTAAPALVHGVATDGTELNGSFQLQRFREKQGVLYAVGTLTGVLGTQPFDQKVMLPVTSATNPAPEQAQGLRQPVPTPGACDILTLGLGPLDLDLLGLRVALDPVNLLIEAIPGAGNLLGNLLCGVAGLLDGGLGLGLGGLLNNLLDAIADLLNGLLGGL
jgi:hypothetical protein